MTPPKRMDMLKAKGGVRKLYIFLYVFLMIIYSVNPLSIEEKPGTTDMKIGKYSISIDKSIYQYYDEKTHYYSGDDHDLLMYEMVYKGHESIEMELIINSYSGKNTFNVPFDINDLVPIKQNPLSIENGPQCTETDCPTGEHRPIDVVNSYALYKDGKEVLHVSRPIAYDMEGKISYGDMVIKDDYMTIIIDEDFLKNAVYPLIIDPIIGGYTGSSNDGTWGLIASGPVNFTGEVNISVMGLQYTGNSIHAFWFYVFNDSGGYPTNVTCNSSLEVFPYDFGTYYYNSTPFDCILAPGNYWLGVIHNITSGSINFTTGILSGYEANVYTHIENMPAGASLRANREYSLYAYYENTSGAPPPCGIVWDNTTWSDFVNVSICYDNDTIWMESIRYENDTTCGGSNYTYYNSTDYPCDNCSPSMEYTTWTDFINVSICFANDTILQQSNSTYFDSLFCLPDAISNSTVFNYSWGSCDNCTPSNVSTTWSEFSNVSSCYVNNTILQYSTRTVYDENYCIGSTNETFINSTYVNCTYVIVTERGYSLEYMNDTRLFNLAKINFNNTPGVLMFLFSILFLASCVWYCEHTGISALRVLTGIVGVFYSWVLFSAFSVIIGISFFMVAIGYIFYGLHASV